MTKQIINTGAAVNDRSGDTLRSGGTKINSNFNELYTAIGNGTAIQFSIDFTTTPTAGQSLQYNSSTGKFTPGSSVSSQGSGYVDNAVVRYDGVTGTIIQSSSVSILDNGRIVANSFSGDGSLITDLNAGQLTSGIIPNARFPEILPAASGANLTALNATNISSGTVSVNRLGVSGARNATTFLRGDNTWASVNLSRAAVAGTTASLANSASGNLTIAGYKGYMLYKIQTSAAAWVRIYTDSASRSADATRPEGSDPVPGSGVVAEVITTGAQTILISPGALGFSNETVPDTNIQLLVTNKSGDTAAITVTLTAVQLEA
jgi:hypothetical protein